MTDAPANETATERQLRMGHDRHQGEVVEGDIDAARSIGMLGSMPSARTSVALADGGVATVLEPSMRAIETLAWRDQRANPRPNSVVGQVQQVTIRPPYSEAPYQIISTDRQGWWIADWTLDDSGSSMADNTHMYDTPQEADEVLVELQRRWCQANTRVMPLTDREYNVEADGSITFDRPPEAGEAVHFEGSYDSQMRFNANVYRVGQIVQVVDGDGNDITRDITPELRQQMIDQVARDMARRAEQQMLETLMQPNTLLDSMPTPRSWAGTLPRDMPWEPSIQWPLEDTLAVEPTTEDVIRETWSVERSASTQTSYLVLHGGDIFAGPFRREDHAEAVMRACIYAPERLDLPTSYKKKGRVLDITTAGEVALQRRIKDLEWVIADLLAPVTPGREVHPGRRMIQGWYYPERLEAARRVVNTGEPASGVYSETKGDISGGNEGGRRRGMRISD